MSAVGSLLHPDDFPEPLDGDVWLSCPDPLCAHPFEYPEHLVRQGLAVVPGHVDTTGQDRCWLGGYEFTAARQMVEMRTADNGRLMRAAHP